MSIDLFVGDLQKVNNDVLFQAITEFAATQPAEGWRHDYTEAWDDSALKCIGAFANTFGGLLIVGVKKQKQDPVCEFTGVNSPGEYKTRIASSIAANIAPTPSYEIFELSKPGFPNLKFCIVRVRGRSSLHLVTKKGLQPAYVRNEDEARPADAAQLRRLVDREKEMPESAQRLGERACQLRDALLINRGYQDKDSSEWFRSPRQPSASFLKMQLIPTERLSFEMDRVHEQQFKNLLMPVYPRVAECVSRGVAQQAESRDADYYEYAWYHKKLDYEGRWRITSTGEYAYATQMEYSEGSGSKAWSVVDLAIQSILFLRGATRWWETISFFGDGRLYAQLNLDGLQLLQSPISGNYPHAVNLAYKAEVDQNVLKLARDTIVRSVAPKSSASADVGLNYFSGSSDLATVAASLLNKLLRSLGHAVVVKRLEEITKSLSVSLA